MNYFAFILLVILFFGVTLNVQSGAAYAAFYAEKPVVPNDLSKSFFAISIEKAIIPDAAVVGVPIYPNAKIINSYKGVQSPEGNFKRLPFLELISTDSYDLVVNFYKEKLLGWKQGGFNTALYFAEKGEVNMFSPESTHAGIHDVLKYYREDEQKDLQKIIPGAKSLIKIFYSGIK